MTKKIVLLLAMGSFMAFGFALDVGVASAKKKSGGKCHCKQGPRGPRGFTGPAGPPGPAGPAGSGGGGGGGGTVSSARVYAAQAPGTGASTVDTTSNGVLSLSCSLVSAITLNFITNGDVVSQIASSQQDAGANSGAEAEDPEGTTLLNTATDGLLTAAVNGGTADGGNGSQFTYNLDLADGGTTPDSPPSGCLVAGTKVTA